MDAAAFEAHTERLFEEAPTWLARARATGTTFADLFAEHGHHTQHHLYRRSGRHPKSGTHSEAIEAVSLRGLDAAGNAAFAHGSLDAAATLPGHLGHAELASRPVVELAAPVGSLVLPPDAPDGISETEKAHWLEQLTETAFALDEAVMAVNAQVHDTVRRIAVATTTGFTGLKTAQRIRVRLDVEVRGAHGSVTGYVIEDTTDGYNRLFATDPRRWALRAAERARHRAAARQIEGAVPVILAEGAAATWVHEVFGHTLEADVAAQRGLLQARGTRLTALPLTLVDQPPQPFDDEGTCASPRTLIHAGVLQHVLAGRATALQHGVAATGHARRQDVRHPPLTRIHHLTLAPGNTTLGALIAEVSDGLLVTQIAAGSMRPDDDTYRLTVVNGWRIENGRRTYPVADVVLGGRLSDAWGALRGMGCAETTTTETGLCGKYGQVVPVTTTSPALLVHGLTCSPAK